MSGKLQVSTIESSAANNKLVVSGDVSLDGSGLTELIIPDGTYNETRDGTPVAGSLRYDKSRGCMMVHDGDGWRITQKQNEWDLVPTNGLVGHYDAACPLSYPGHGNAWFDLSPAKNHFYASTLGTREPKWYQSDFGGGWYFGGGDAQTWKGIMETRQKNMTNHVFDYTILSWVKFVRVGTHARYYLLDSRIEDGNKGGGLGIDRESGTQGSAFHFTQDGSSTYDEPTNPFFEDTKVYMLGCVRTGTSIKVINNDSHSLISPSLVYDLLSTAYIPLGRMRLGTYSGAGSGTTEFWWAGHVYTVHMYDRALSQTEIDEIYNIYAPRFGFTVV